MKCFVFRQCLFKTLILFSCATNDNKVIIFYDLATMGNEMISEHDWSMILR